MNVMRDPKKSRPVSVKECLLEFVTEEEQKLKARPRRQSVTEMKHNLMLFAQVHNARLQK